ncbi:MAG: CBS domain-containing protein [Pirellulales bacterium]
MNLSELFRNQVVTAEPQESVRSVAQKMKSGEVGAVVIVQAGKVVGIVTDRDLVVRAIAGAGSIDGPVADVMSRDVVTIWDDQGVFNATQYVRGRKIRRIPIVDRQEKLIGMLSADDLFALLARETLNVAEGLEPALGSRV